jgi:hypothetical protein
MNFSRFGMERVQEVALLDPGLNYFATEVRNVPQLA